MFPESSKVYGAYFVKGVGYNEIGWEECNQFAINVVQRIMASDKDYDTFFGFKKNIYFAPAFDNRLYQEDLDEEEYSKWVAKFLTSDYSANFVSPFSANNSNLRDDVYLEKSFMQDRTTLFELDVLSKLKISKEYIKSKKKPFFIGPDRSTVEHTINVLKSYAPDSDKENPSIRPDYR